MAAITPPESDSLTLYEKRSELKRILESKHFAKAPKRRRFLEFTSGQVFLGEEGKLNEYLIGVEVYERGDDFDPQQDPIVRVQAHEIRRTLRNYYEGEGKDNPVRVELHPGQYAPVFKRVNIDSEPPVATAAVGKSPTERPAWPTAHVWYAAMLVVGLACACAALGFWVARARYLSQPHVDSRVVAPLPESEEWFWKPFLVPESQPLVVVPTPPLLRLGTEGDTPQTLKDGFTIPKNKIPKFQDTVHFREFRNFIFVPTTTDYTGIGDALGLVKLTRLFTEQGITIRVKSGRLTDYTEIQGGNAIIVGGGNTWSNRVFATLPGFNVSSGVFKNDAAKPSEPSVYAPAFDPVTNRLTQDYALILMKPNHTKQERLLLLYGLYTQGTQAAAEYVTNPDRLAELHRALVAASPDKKTAPSFFEALISVPVENDVPGDASLVGVRTLPD